MNRDEPFCEPDHFCTKCDQYEMRINGAANIFQGLLEQMYGSKFDDKYCDWLMEELASYLDVEMEDKPIQIKSKK